MNETHKLFPSGIWDGFYIYQSGPDASRYPMFFHLDFSDGSVTGSGSDNVGGFTWKGRYDTQTFVVQMIKHYPFHDVFYDGRADESGIFGGWTIQNLNSGGFHIWPRKQEAEAEEQAVEAVVVEKIKA